MNDKDYRNFALVVGGAFLLWWLYQRKLNAQQSQDIPSDMGDSSESNPSDPSPADQVYAQNPQSFDPGTINVNIGNQGTAYMPLFGFVGVAQGMMYQ